MQLADDVIAVMDHIGVDRADGYGTSMGGRGRPSIAVRHCDRVRALVLGCTSPGGAHGVERDNAVRRSLINRESGAARRALFELMYMPNWLALTPAHTRHWATGDAAECLFRGVPRGCGSTSHGLPARRLTYLPVTPSAGGPTCLRCACRQSATPPAGCRAPR